MAVKQNVKAKISCILLCLLICLAPLTVLAEQADHVIINILSINDLHGALLPTKYYPGVAKVAAVIKEEKAKDPEALFFAAGDMMQGTYESNELRGAPIIEALNAMGVKASAVGNHEFDWGVPAFQKIMASSQFPWLAANIMDKKTGQRSQLWQPYAVYEVKGVKVGVIGLATPETAVTSNPLNVADFTFADPAQAVQAVLPELKAKGVDVIVVLSHLGSLMDKKSGQLSGEAVTFAQAVPEVNAVITAHSHQEVCGMVGSAAMIQAASQGRLVGKLTIDYNKATKTVETVTPSIIKVSGAQSDPDMEGIVKKAVADIGPIRNQVLGQLNSPLNRAWSEQSPMGQWVTDNMRQAVKADMAFTNAGGLRANLAAGSITKGMIYEVMPFENTLYTVDMTGAQVYELLQYGLIDIDKGTMQFSGLHITYDPDKKAFVNVTLSDGSKLERDKTYHVVTNDFMAVGGDGFNIFKQGCNGLDTHISIRSVLENAFQNKAVDFVPDDRFKVEEKQAAYDKAA